MVAHKVLPCCSLERGRHIQATSCDTAPTAAIGDAVEAAGGAEAGGGATAPKAVGGITLRHTQLFARLSPDPAEAHWRALHDGLAAGQRALIDNGRCCVLTRFRVCALKFPVANRVLKTDVTHVPNQMKIVCPSVPLNFLS